MAESEKNKTCWNCWYDEFCDWHPAGDEDACEEYTKGETVNAGISTNYIKRG